MFLKGILLLGYPAISDWRSRRFYIGPVIMVSIILSIIQILCKEMTLFSVIIGCVPGVITWFFSRWSQGAIGEGDAFVIGGLGMVTGWRMVFASCLLAGMMCAMAGAVLLAVRRARKRTELPFIPFLTVAFILNCCMNL